MSKISGRTRSRNRLALPMIAFYQGGVCFYCDKRFVFYTDMTADHLFPYSKGGVGSSINVVAACPQCNRSKGNTIPLARHLVKALDQASQMMKCKFKQKRIKYFERILANNVSTVPKNSKVEERYSHNGEDRRNQCECVDRGLGAHVAL